MCRGWTFNGLIIQNLDASTCREQISYSGIGRYVSWPLKDKTDVLSKSINKEADERWFNYFFGESNDKYALAVIPSLDYIQRYLNICKDYDLNLRILHIETNREEPKWEGPNFKETFLGYDYVTSQDFYSTILDDLFGLVTPPILADSKSVLNEYGLFKTEDAINLYIENRNKAIIEGYDLEDFGDFCKCKVFLVTEQIEKY